MNPGILTLELLLFRTILHRPLWSKASDAQRDVYSKVWLSTWYSYLTFAYRLLHPIAALLSPSPHYLLAASFPKPSDHSPELHLFLLDECHSTLASFLGPILLLPVRTA